MYAYCNGVRTFTYTYIQINISVLESIVFPVRIEKYSRRRMLFFAYKLFYLFYYDNTTSAYLILILHVIDLSMDDKAFHL